MIVWLDTSVFWAAVESVYVLYQASIRIGLLACLAFILLFAVSEALHSVAC